MGLRPIDAQRIGGHVAVARERRAGECGRPERGFVETLAGVGKPAAVTSGHLHRGQQVMSECDRLRSLQVREPGHQGAGVRQRLFGKGTLIGGKCNVERVDGVAHPQSEVGRDLVITRAGRVQPAGRLPDQLRKAALHIHVDVFQSPLE